MPKIDIFISHASEDKDEVARPLAEQLHNRGYNVWYDRFILKLGDNLRQEIDKGLASCRFGVVVLSHSFFAKHFPQVELDGLAAREGTNGQKIILPIWHNLTYNNVAQYSPTLAGKLAAKTSDGLDAVVAQIIDVLGPADSGSVSDRSVPETTHRMPASHPPPTAPLTQPASQASAVAPTDANEAIQRARILLPQQNQSRWHRFIDSTLKAAKDRILAVRNSCESGPIDRQKLSRACDETVTASAPVIAAAICATESEQPSVRDQRSLLNELPLIKGWNLGGIVPIINLNHIPVAIYHHLLGGFLLQSRRHEDALDLWLYPVPYYLDSQKKTELWRAHHLNSYVEALGARNNLTWPFIKGLYAAQPWLANFFDDVAAYEDSVRAYFWLGSVIELADYVKKGGRFDGRDGISFDIAPAFLDPAPDISDLRRAIRHAVPSAELFHKICSHFGVEPTHVRNAWPHWLGVMLAWNGNARYPFFRASDIYFGQELPTLP